MTIDEYRCALDALPDEDYDKFQHYFGGQRISRADRVSQFVHDPKLERFICSLLNLETEEEKITRASVSRRRQPRSPR